MRFLLTICAFRAFLSSIICQPGKQHDWKSHWLPSFPNGSQLSPPHDWQPILPYNLHPTSDYSLPATTTNTMQSSWLHSFPDSSHLSPPQDWQPSLPHISHPSSEHSLPAISMNTLQSSWPHSFPDSSHLSPPHDWQPLLPHNSHPTSDYSWQASSSNIPQSSLTHRAQPSGLNGAEPTFSHGAQPSLPQSKKPRLSKGEQPSLPQGEQLSLPQGKKHVPEYRRELIIKDWGYSEVAFWNIGKLFYIDTYAYKLCAYHPETRHTTCCIIGYPEEFVVGGANSIILIRWDSSKNWKHPEYTVLESVEDLPLGSRWSYGSVDYKDMLWIATTNDYADDRERNLGGVYSLDKFRNLEVKLSNISSITGGFVWDLRRIDEATRRAPPNKFYLADTVKREVVLYDYRIRVASTIRNRQGLFNLTLHGLRGDPGRLAIDDRGWLWVPLLGGHGVIEFNPFEKRTDRFIDIPAAKVGGCTFGGDNMEILYVSTIGYEYKEPHDHRPHGDQGGHIYAIHDLGVNGVQTREYYVHSSVLPQKITQIRVSTDMMRSYRLQHARGGEIPVSKP